MWRATIDAWQEDLMVNPSYGSSANMITTLDACILIEEACAVIYRNFAQIFSDSAVSALWSKIAEDEDIHREQFVLARQAHGTGYLNQDTENYLINEILTNLNLLKDEIRNNVPTLKEALIISAILERSIENYHVETGKLMLDEKLATLVSEMSDYDKGHKEIFQLAVDSIESGPISDVA
jgi:rubrerythrin